MNENPSTRPSSNCSWPAFWPPAGEHEAGKSATATLPWPARVHRFLIALASLATSVDHREAAQMRAAVGCRHVVIGVPARHQQVEAGPNVPFLRAAAIPVLQDPHQVAADRVDPDRGLRREVREQDPLTALAARDLVGRDE